jgi:predicted amidohydrolase YtcJ
MPTDDQKRTGFSRRDFIKGAAIAAGGAVLGGTAAGAATAAGVTALGNAPGSLQKGQSACDESQDLALVNGKFLTMDDKDSVVSAVAIRNGRIAEVGRHPQALGPCAQTINLRGATVIPGLIDSHIHFIRCGINPGHEVRIIETATSIAELQQMISDRAQTVPAGDFITCIGGWNRNGFAEKRLPTPSELDTAAPQNPVYLSETGGGGQAIANTSGIAFFQSQGVTVDSNAGTLNANQGLAALQAVQTDADKQRGTGEVMDFASSLGLTMIHDHGGLSGLTSYQYALNLWRQGNLKVRQRPFFWSGDDTGFSIEQARILNNFNRLGDDFWRPIGVGERLNTSTTNPGFVDACKFAASNGWTLTQHSLTLAEVQFHVAAYQEAATVGPIDQLRWSLCHVNPITDDLIQAVVDLGIGVNIQGTPYTSALGSTPSGPPFRKLLDAGIPAGGGSDATNVAALNPWLMMYYMTTGKNNAGDVLNPGQTISRLEALRLYTIGSAYLSFDDDSLGTIEEGKLADLAVLSDDPLKVSDDKLRKISSVLTLQAGKVVHGEIGRSHGRS